jgi:hypothetical protein
MKNRIILMLMPFAVVASCSEAQQDQNGIKATPGFWTANYRILSYRVNGTPIDTANIPAEELRKLNADVGCSSMNLSSKEDISQMMTTYNKAESQCTITSINEDGANFNFKGYCEMPPVAGMQHKAMFSVSGTQSPQKLLIDATGKSILKHPTTGASAIMESDLKGMLTRTGDC